MRNGGPPGGRPTSLSGFEHRRDPRPDRRLEGRPLQGRSGGSWVLEGPEHGGPAPREPDRRGTRRPQPLPKSCDRRTQPNGGGLGTDDIDDGVVVARSASVDLSGFPEARVSLNRWFANRDTGEDTGDFWRLEVRESDTSPDVLLEELDTNQSAAQWTEVTFRLADFINVSTAEPCAE